MKKYYKTNCEKALFEHKSMNEAKDKLVVICDEFARKFNARAMVKQGSSSISFGGLVLNNYYHDTFSSNSEVRDDTLLWTVPDSNGVSRPKSSLTHKQVVASVKWSERSGDMKAKAKLERTRLVELQNKYNAERKIISEVSMEPFFNSIGTDWGNLMLSGLEWFEIDGFMYFATSLNFSENMTEILGSEFESAQLKSKGKQ